MRGSRSIRYRSAVTAVLAGLLVVSALLVLCPEASAAGAGTGGDDVSAPQAVKALTDAGILAGRDSSSFVPADPVTRGQLAGYLARALGLTDVGTGGFTDVRADEWYGGGVGAMYQAGLLTGAGPGSFSPDEPASREEAVSWVVSALGYRVDQDPDFVIPYRLPRVEEDAWLAGFRDRDMIAPQYAWGVANGYRLGLVEDDNDGWFYPDFPLTRTQAALLLYRAFVQPAGERSAPPAAAAAESSYPKLSIRSEGPLVAYVEGKLASMSYCPGPVDGVYDQKTRDAVMAFEKVEKLTRDGVVGDAVWEHIFTATTPAPHLTAEGYRIEVDLSRQVMMFIDNNKVWKIVHVSTGKNGTRTGHFAITSKIPGWVKLVTLDGYFYYPSYFVSRTAIHGYDSVPAWPASHGCVRTPMWMAVDIFYQTPSGTPVDVFYS